MEKNLIDWLEVNVQSKSRVTFGKVTRDNLEEVKAVQKAVYGAVFTEEFYWNLVGAMQTFNYKFYSITVEKPMKSNETLKNERNRKEIAKYSLTKDTSSSTTPTAETVVIGIGFGFFCSVEEYIRTQGGGEAIQRFLNPNHKVFAVSIIGATEKRLQLLKLILQRMIRHAEQNPECFGIVAQVGYYDFKRQFIYQGEGFIDLGIMEGSFPADKLTSRGKLWAKFTD